MAAPLTDADIDRLSGNTQPLSDADIDRLSQQSQAPTSRIGPVQITWPTLEGLKKNWPSMAGSAVTGLGAGMGLAGLPALGEAIAAAPVGTLLRTGLGLGAGGLTDWALRKMHMPTPIPEIGGAIAGVKVGGPPVQKGVKGLARLMFPELLGGSAAEVPSLPLGSAGNAGEFVPGPPSLTGEYTGRVTPVKRIPEPEPFQLTSPPGSFFNLTNPPQGQLYLGEPPTPTTAAQAPTNSVQQPIGPITVNAKPDLSGIPEQPQVSPQTAEFGRKVEMDRIFKNDNIRAYLDKIGISRDEWFDPRTTDKQRSQWVQEAWKQNLKGTSPPSPYQYIPNYKPRGNMWRTGSQLTPRAPLGGQLPSQPWFDIPEMPY